MDNELPVEKIGYSTTLGKMCEYLTTIGEFADFQVVLIQNLFRHIYNYQDKAKKI